MCLEWVLKQHGIEPFVDVEIITSLAFEAAVGAFEAGLGDYIAQFEPALSEIEARGGRGKIVASIGAEAGPLTYTVFTLVKVTLRRTPTCTCASPGRSIKGSYGCIVIAPREVAEMIAPFFPPLIDLDILTLSMTLYQSIDAWPPNPVPSEEHFLHLQDIMIEAGELEEYVPFHS